MTVFTRAAEKRSECFLTGNKGTVQKEEGMHYHARQHQFLSVPGAGAHPPVLGPLNSLGTNSRAFSRRGVTPYMAVSCGWVVMFSRWRMTFGICARTAASMDIPAARWTDAAMLRSARVMLSPTKKFRVARWASRVCSVCSWRSAKIAWI